MDRYDAQTIETKWQRIWDESRAFEVPNPKPGAPRNERKTYVLEMLPYPSGTLHIGPRPRSTRWATSSAHFYRRTGSGGAAADGLRLVRAARGERRDRRRASIRARSSSATSSRIRAHDEAARLGDRLVTRVLDARARVLPLDAVALPEVLRGAATRTARLRWSTGAPTTRPCWRTSRSKTAAASAAAPRSSAQARRSGSSASPPTPTACSTR